MHSPKQLFSFHQLPFASTHAEIESLFRSPRLFPTNPSHESIFLNNEDGDLHQENGAPFAAGKVLPGCVCHLQSGTPLLRIQGSAGGKDLTKAATGGSKTGGKVTTSDAKPGSGTAVPVTTPAAPVSPQSPVSPTGNGGGWNAKKRARKNQNKKSKLVVDIADIRKDIVESLKSSSGSSGSSVTVAAPTTAAPTATGTEESHIDDSLLRFFTFAFRGLGFAFASLVLLLSSFLCYLCNLDNMPGAMDKLTRIDGEVKELRQEVQKFSKEVVNALAKLEQKLNSLNLGAPAQTSQTGAGTAPAKAAAPAKKEEAKKADDDIDLFGSDSDDEEAEKNRAARAAAHLEKKSKKPAVIAKSMITLDVKPWDDETDVKEMEKAVRSIEADGLLWGTSKFADVAFGIKKLVITCVVEDDKVGTDFLEESITAFEELVQSVDIASFNKI
ncbi:putative Elongation factor 1-delta [Hypsibius exemplaris]|uniref:Elongation factor 1-delta n=1 Tax=Hypsibius exemplaris TaxID=2072580 RepID=A0A1W0WFA5_HYPEX|nr:putative Elongation factor 1-delta [Hypsibius exemplaris]